MPDARPPSPDTAARTTRRGVARRALLAAPLAWCVAARGSPAARWPALDLRGAGGVPLPPVAADGRVTHVDFWASWCAPCRLSFPWMNQMHERWAAQGLRIVAVNLDRRDADALRFLAQNPARFELAFDPAGDSARRLDIQAMPTSLLVGRDGTLVHTHRGFRAEDRPVLEGLIRDALA
jgi:cytochrome c biogenesis protein CcmG, thiol:disulfide interchange protein DsbE